MLMDLILIDIVIYNTFLVVTSMVYFSWYCSKSGLKAPTMSECCLRQPSWNCLGQSASSEPEMGVSENSVPLNPMVNDHYPY